MMSSPGGASSSGAVKPDLFEDLWKQLGETHRNSLQELEAKVSKLKRDRCLDAQRLEVFYNRNQQLKEQNKTLQNTISHLEERLMAGGCDRCAVLEEKLKRTQDQNLQVVTKLENERNVLQVENRKLEAELQKLRTSRSESEPTSSTEQEEGVIPDSPTMPSSLPAVNKLRKRKRADKNKHVRYAEMRLCSNPLLHELNKDSAEGAKNRGKTEVLVPNTCELDPSQTSSERREGTQEAVAETCGLDLLHHNKTEAAPRQSSSKRTWKHKLRFSPDSASDRSPSLFPRVRRLSGDGSVCKWKKGEGDPEAQTGGDAGVREGKHVKADLIDQTTTSVGHRSLKEQPESKAESAQKEASCHKSGVSCESPPFKKPPSKIQAADGKRRTLQDLNAAHKQPEGKDADGRSAVEPAWSVDPALSLLDGEQEGDEEVEERRHADLTDTDCTWVSHSVLQRRQEDGEDGGDGKSGLGEKATDSLDMMFDTTACGTYKSYNSPHSDQGGDEEEEDHREQDGGEAAACPSKSGQPTFKYVAVVRKKDERRKLKGTTCKECENYYSHLPEEEKQKKLSACSRHRFLYVPPCTPDNFWEVGFPSTQTCIERGYIKEEKNPQARLRRRQPLNALFSPKPKQIAERRAVPSLPQVRLND